MDHSSGLVFRRPQATLTADLWSIFAPPFSYILSFHTALGAEGIWWAFPASNVSIAAITVLWFLKGDWKRTRLTEEQRVAEEVSEEILIEEGMH